MRCGRVLLACVVALAVAPVVAQESLDDLEYRLEGAKKAEAAKQVEANRKAEVARRADASKATIVVKADGDCALSVNGDSLGRLAAGKTRTVKVNAGEQLIECEAADGRRVETTERVPVGEQKVLRLSLSGAVEATGSGTSSDGRFSRVVDGVRDAQQGVVWAAADNGSDVTWSQAKDYCTGKGSDWSLPTVAQLQSLYDESWRYKKMVAGGLAISPATSLIVFSGVRYWSDEHDGSSSAFAVGLDGGTRNSYSGSDLSVPRSLCVRRRS